MMTSFNPAYWNNRYIQENTPWDLGQPSPPLTHFIDRLTDKELKILIPGAGRAYEAIYLHQQGFNKVWVCDWAEDSFDYIRKNHPQFPADHLMVQNFFDLNLKVDLILEHTFFCAILPKLRSKYVAKSFDLLVDSGQIAGLFFNFPLVDQGPPFGGDADLYEQYFSSSFKILELSPTPYSVPERQGKELFFHFRKK